MGIAIMTDQRRGFSGQKLLFSSPSQTASSGKAREQLLMARRQQYVDFHTVDSLISTSMRIWHHFLSSPCENHQSFCAPASKQRKTSQAASPEPPSALR
eukprot:112360-Rhodomonas_salina.1